MKKIIPASPPRVSIVLQLCSVGLQVGILHGTSEGGIKCPVDIVVMTVALPCGDGTDSAFICKPVVYDGCPLQRRQWDEAVGADRCC